MDMNKTSSIPTGDDGTAPLTLTVEEAAAALRIGRSAAYDAVRRGDIPVLRIGRRVLVPRQALLRLLDQTIDR